MIRGWDMVDRPYRGGQIILSQTRTSFACVGSVPVSHCLGRNDGGGACHNACEYRVVIGCNKMC